MLMLYIIVNSQQNDLISYYHSFNIFFLSLAFCFFCFVCGRGLSCLFHFSSFHCASLDDDNSYVFSCYSQRIWHFNNDGVSCSFEPMIEPRRFFIRFTMCAFFSPFQSFQAARLCVCVLFLSFSSIKQRRFQTAEQQQLKRLRFVVGR